MRVKSRSKIVALGCIFTLLIFAMSGFITSLSAFANETRPAYSGNFLGYSQDMGVEELHEKTLIKGILDDEPTMTVLVPGQGGTASHWSNSVGMSSDLFFSEEPVKFDEDSMIEVLRNQAGGADVYLASNKFDYIDHTIRDEEGKTISNGFCSLSNTIPKYACRCGYCRIQIGFTLNRLDMPKTEDTQTISDFKGSSRQVGDYIKSGDLEKLPNVDKHIIILFEGSPGARSNSHWVLNDELNYVLDKLSYDYQVLTGKLPVLNMVAHSRGGLSSVIHASGYEPRILPG